ncbi:TPA: DNA mismatch repair protein MutT [Streptococcus suis]|nr:DNA mismatch repair protein MutT [Streptococcus suis]HEM3686172.1 DNA mismatch repair protein MutT [Streptococcus suis]HEM3694221.1 DNA mismatch repair protein MutT [Streptococcus suis]
MSRTEQVILTNMCMITDGQRVLVQDRKSEKWPGVTFPGGDCVIIMTGA